MSRWASEVLASIPEPQVLSDWLDGLHGSQRKAWLGLLCFTVAECAGDIAQASRQLHLPYAEVQAWALADTGVMMAIERGRAECGVERARRERAG